jgi:hypothetical protein
VARVIGLEVPRAFSVDPSKQNHFSLKKQTLNFLYVGLLNTNCRRFESCRRNAAASIWCGFAQASLLSRQENKKERRQSNAFAYARLLSSENRCRCNSSDNDRDHLSIFAELITRGKSWQGGSSGSSCLRLSLELRPIVATCRSLVSGPPTLGPGSESRPTRKHRPTFPRRIRTECRRR